MPHQKVYISPIECDLLGAKIPDGMTEEEFIAQLVADGLNELDAELESRSKGQGCEAIAPIGRAVGCAEERCASIAEDAVRKLTTSYGLRAGGEDVAGP